MEVGELQREIIKSKISYCFKKVKSSLFKVRYSVFIRGGSRTAATSKMERFVIIVYGWKPLTIITKRSILDVAAVLDPPLFISTQKRRLLYIYSNKIISFFLPDSHYRR